MIITKTFLFNIYRLSPIKLKEIKPEKTQEIKPDYLNIQHC